MHGLGPDSEIKLMDHPVGTGEATQCYTEVMQKAMHFPPVLKKNEPRLPRRLSNAHLHSSHRPVVTQIPCNFL